MKLYVVIHLEFIPVEDRGVKDNEVVNEDFHYSFSFELTDVADGDIMPVVCGCCEIEEDILHVVIKIYPQKLVGNSKSCPIPLLTLIINSSNLCHVPIRPIINRIHSEPCLYRIHSR